MADLKASLWFDGICDVVLIKVARWNENYYRGEVESTCKFLDPNQGVIDKPTRYAHRLPWGKSELQHLVRIVAECRPNTPLAEEVAKAAQLWRRGRRVIGPGDQRIITWSFYPQHVKEILDCLYEAKRGPSKADVTIEARKSQGKELFEM